MNIDSSWHISQTISLWEEVTDKDVKIFNIYTIQFLVLDSVKFVWFFSKTFDLGPNTICIEEKWYSSIETGKKIKFFQFNPQVSSIMVDSWKWN